MEPSFSRSRPHSPDAISDPWTRIVGYLAGDGSPAERVAVEQWLHADPGRISAFQQIREEWNAKPTFRELIDLDTAWASISRAIDTDSSRPTSAGTRADRRHTMSRAANQQRRWMVTRSILALGIVALIGFFSLGRWEQDAPSGTAIYQTTPGQRTTITLADGSAVTLAPATTVRVAKNAVIVAGEAYFTIAPSAIRPVFVQTRNVAVQVLGTRFWVRQYPDEAQTRVVVDDGKIGLRSLRALTSTSTRETYGAHAVLSARMMAQVSDSGITVTSGISTREYTGGTQGTLVFRRVPLRDVIVELNRGYGADIRVKDSVLAGEPIIAEVDVTNRSLSQVLEFICFVMNAHYVSQGNTIMLLPGRIERHSPPSKLPQFRQPQPEKLYGR